MRTMARWIFLFPTQMTLSSRLGKNVFPELFKELDEMSEDLRKHIRYPADLFTIQAFIYATYHMKNTAGILQQRGPVGNPRNRL